MAEGYHKGMKSSIEGNQICSSIRCLFYLSQGVRSRVLTTEDIEYKGCRLTPAGGIRTSKGDGLSRFLHLIIVFLEVEEYLARTGIQGRGPVLSRACHLECFPLYAGFRGPLYLRPQT
jgi:hypothetical protein